MGVLQRFERRLGSLVEGAFAKVFRGGVEPVEIAGALQREADDHKTIVSATRTLVPNDFLVSVGPADWERLAPYAETLGDELATMVSEHCQESGYSTVGPLRVRLQPAADLAIGTFRIHSGVEANLAERAPVSPLPPAGVEPAQRAYPVAGGPGVAGRATPSYAPPVPAAPPGAVALTGHPLPGRPRLVVATGGSADPTSPAAHGEEMTFPIAGDVTVIGRGSRADLRLTDASVSREHARVERRHLDGQDVFEIVDLGSTNGTQVNGRLVQRAELANGARVSVGSVQLVFVTDPPG